MRTKKELMAEWKKGRNRKEQLVHEILRYRKLIEQDKSAGRDGKEYEYTLLLRQTECNITDGILKGLEWAMGAQGVIFTNLPE